jgi:hypothetical protein
MPVRAWPMTSAPRSASGRVSSWMANVRSMPAARRVATISGCTPSSSKVGESGRTGAPARNGREVSVSSVSPVSLWSST